MDKDSDQLRSLGTWLRRQRKAHDLTQAQLAQRVGCAVDTIKKLETDMRRPSSHLAARITTVLAVPSEEREVVLQVVRGERTADDLPIPNQPLAGSNRHQLRTPLPDFVGQQAAITMVLEHIRSSIRGGAAAIVGVRGMGGIGKTELVMLVANRLIGAFPDAQVVVALRGTSTEPLPVEQALQQVIRAFTPEAKLPDKLEELQRHYHSLLHGQRVLILADDARDAEQVRALLPPRGSALLVTSRVRFTMPGMLALDLEPLGEEAAVRLLRQLCGRLRAADARTLAQACGYLPLALRISASLLHNDPALSVAAYLAKLADERQRLDQLRDPDDTQLDVEASLALSYAQLDEPVQRVFRQLGVFVADFDTALALAVVEVPPGVEVERSMHRLLRRNLVMYDGERERWRLHDLVRDLALRTLEGAGEWESVMWRYARAAVQIAQAVNEQYRAGGEGELLALARFDTERPHIDAMRRWAAEQAGTDAGDALLVANVVATNHIGIRRYDRWSERLPHIELALAAASRRGDRLSEGMILNSLGLGYLALGDAGRALPYFAQRRAVAQAIDDRRGEGIACNNLGEAYMVLGDPHQALPCFEQAHAITQAIGNRSGEAVALANIGEVALALGNIQQALDFLDSALALFRIQGSQIGEAMVLNTLGRAYLILGNAHRAMACFEQALALARACGDQRQEGYALSDLAHALALQGDRARATTTFQQALALFPEVSDRWGEAMCQWQFGLALAQQGEQELALPLLRTALIYQQEIKHAKAKEHAALVTRLEAGEPLPPELYILPTQLAIGDDSDKPTDNNAQP